MPVRRELPDAAAPHADRGKFSADVHRIDEDQRRNDDDGHQDHGSSIGARAPGIRPGRPVFLSVEIPMDRTQDHHLVARMRARDERAVNDLATLYGSKIQQLALRYMKNREDAEEITQDVLLKVYRKADAFRGDSALSSWIYRITFNTAMSRLRASRLARAADRERDRLLSVDSPEGRPRALRQVADRSRLPDAMLLRTEVQRAVAEAISGLPETYRAPILLRDIEGLTTQEASRRLKLKDQTLKSRLHRGRLMLRDRLVAIGASADFAKAA